jgi:TP901 family phage tail tape measure protein
VTDRTVSVALKAQVAGFVAPIGTAIKTTQTFNAELAKLGKESPEKFRRVTDAAGTMGLALLGAFALAVKGAADFDKQMSEVGAVSGASGAELGRLRDAALEAGKATQYSATEAAKAEAELAKAGLNTSQILGGALAGSLALAAAGDLDLAEAADTTAKVLNVFHLQGSQASHVADLLAAAANKSATDVHAMGESIKMGGLAAYAAGLSVEETAGTLALFADNALVGSDAGTSLKTAIMMLQNPTVKASSAMDELGINVYDAKGNFIGMAALAGVLQKQLGGLTQQQRNQALATIFGADGMRAANVLYQAGADKVREYTNEVNDQGAAADVAAKKTDNLAGDVERLKGSLETMMIESGSGANGGLRKLVQMLGSMVDSFGSLPAPVQSTMVVLAGLTGVVLLGATAWAKMRDRAREARESLESMGPTGSKVAGWAGSAAGIIGKVTLALGALQIASAAMASDINPSIEGMTKSLTEYAKTGKVAGEMSKQFGGDLGQLGKDMQILKSGALDKFGTGLAEWVEGITGLGNVIDDSTVHGKERLQELDQALASMASSGHADQAAQAFDRLAAEAKENGVSVEELKAGLPQYSAALDNATNSQQKAIQATEEQQTKTVMLAGSLTAAIDAAGGFKNALDQINGVQLSVNETTIDAEEAVDKLTDSINKNGRSLDLSSEKGRANQTALDNLATKARDAAQAVYDQTGDVNAAAATFQRYKDQMIAAYIQMGKTKDQARALADQIMGIPPNKTITITTWYVTRTGSVGGKEGGNKYADGAVVEYYAPGGMRENHIAQIAPAGAWRVWAEDETGGEAYIPLGADKRARSSMILAETNRRLGYPLGGKPGSDGQYAAIVAAGANRPRNNTMTVKVQVEGAVKVRGDGVISGLRDEISILGGDVQQVLGGR